MPTLLVFALSFLNLMPPQAPQPPQRRQYWSGSLVNADCMAEDPKGACLVGKKTTNFGVRTADAKFFKLDPKGNSMAPALIAKAQNQTREMSVGVFGRLHESTVEVEVLQIP
jgi:hypothetical protein